MTFRSRTAVALAAFCFLLLCSTVTGATEDDGIEVKQLADHIYELVYDGGGYDVKVIASIGPDGLLLVDAGTRDKAEAIKARLAELAPPGEPRIIILTHEHVEHVAGAYVYGVEPIVIGHHLLRHNLTSGSYVFDEFGPETLPDIEIRDTVTIHFNGEAIKLIPVAGCHTDDDIMVWFTGSKVACVGAVSNGNHFPSVDRKGDVTHYRGTTQALIDLLPEDTRIIPGHGADGDMSDLRTFHKMLVDTEEMVDSAKTSGKDVDGMIADSLLKDYASWQSYTTCDGWIRYLAETGDDDPDAGKTEIYEPIYRIYKTDGVEAAVAKYREMKTNQADQYLIDEVPTVVIPYKLYINEKWADAMVFSGMFLEEYPESRYVRFCHNVMAECCEHLGDAKGAIEHYQTMYDLREDPDVKAKIDSLNSL